MTLAGGLHQCRTNEADVRKDFINIFWIALGWNVNHEQQTDPYKQEVKVERGVATIEWRKGLRIV